MKRMKIACLVRYGIAPPAFYSAVGISPRNEEGLYEDSKSWGSVLEGYFALVRKLIPTLKRLGISKITIGPGRERYHDGSIEPATNESLRAIRRMLNKSGIEARVIKGVTIIQ